jgi:para-aminobenzoate synthetase component 1
LREYSPAPFSVFYKNENAYLISASPERFLKKKQEKLFSQPIKGTIARNSDPLKDELNKKDLLANPKERAENIMITDLVRNDLTPISEINSVSVDSLCELYSFKHVHQLISTISSTINKDINVYNILKSMFPMGSMTGAPKLNAMKLASKFETFNRGLYSGSVGYIEPDENFDFNVVIRSILYNETNHRISLPAGSAITMESSAGLEYQECLVKIKPLLKILQLNL